MGVPEPIVLFPIPPPLPGQALHFGRFRQRRPEAASRSASPHRHFHPTPLPRECFVSRGPWGVGVHVYWSGFGGAKRKLRPSKGATREPCPSSPILGSDGRETRRQGNPNDRGSRCGTPRHKTREASNSPWLHPWLEGVLVDGASMLRGSHRHAS